MSFSDSETVNSLFSIDSSDSSSDDSFDYEQPMHKSVFNRRSKIIGRLNERYKLNKPYKLKLNICLYTSSISDNVNPRILFDSDTDSSF